MNHNYYLEPEGINFEGGERRKWTSEEDNKLTKLVSKYGTKNWRIIASHLRGRLPKQCRERWINHVDPIITKGRLSDEDWRIVLKAQREVGNRWSEVAKLLPGRTPNQIKNHWHAMVRKRANKRKRQDDTDEEFIEFEEENNFDSPPHPGKESRSAYTPSNKMQRVSCEALQGENYFIDHQMQQFPQTSNEFKKEKTNLDILCQMAEVLYKMEVKPTLFDMKQQMPSEAPIPLPLPFQSNRPCKIVNIN